MASKAWTRPACDSSARSTFSRTVIDANVAATWNVRPTPASAMSRGGRPVMSVPASTTRPASGRSWPLMQLKQVVLPAPFGPISATSSPADTANVASRTACTPSKDFARRWTDRTGANAASATAPPPQPRQCSADPEREKQHDREDQSAGGGSPIIGRACERVLHPGERRGADQRAGDRIQSAEEHHHQGIDRARDCKRLRRDAALRKRIQAAGEPGEATGDRKCAPLRRANV